MCPQEQDQKNHNTRSEIALEIPCVVGKKIDSIPGVKKIGVGVSSQKSGSSVSNKK